MNYKVCVEKTAIKNGVSNSCKMLMEKYESGKVLDYGFGKLRNTKYMLDKSVDLDILDTVEQINKNKDSLSDLDVDKIYSSDENIKPNCYDNILLSYVLNVIPDKSERIKVLENIHNGLKKDGLLYVEVRDYKFLESAKSKIEYNDGYVLGTSSKRTFQKPYDLNEISDFLMENKFDIIECRKYSGSIVLRCKKGSSLI